jgi:hypothetical protein
MDIQTTPPPNVIPESHPQLSLPSKQQANKVEKYLLASSALS